jgi:hypothetical protein
MALERVIDPLLAAEFAKRCWNAVWLVHIDWPGDPVFAHGGFGDISWDGETWRGAQGLAGIQLPAQTQGMAQKIATFQMAGMPDDLVDYLESDARGAEVFVYVGAVTEPSGSMLIGDPLEVFTGLIDGMGQSVEMIDDGDRTGRVRSVQVQARTGPSQRSKTEQYITLDTRQALFPNDTIMRHAQTVVEALATGSLSR